MSKRFVALARVSSREQQREGFSLEVQEDALSGYARREGGEIVKLFRIAETATRPDERRTFKELLAYAKKNAHRLDACSSSKSIVRPAICSIMSNWSGWKSIMACQWSTSRNPRRTRLPDA